MTSVVHEQPVLRRIAARDHVVLAGGVVVVAVVSVAVSLGLTGVALDESLYKGSAVRYATEGPGGLFDDPTARGPARLYPLLIAPCFALFDGDVAVRVARALTGVVWALAAIPVALLARRVVGDRRTAAAAGLLTVATPWMTLGAVLFSEALALLLFALAVLAMLRALEAPSPWRDAVVVGALAALVATRAQFVALAPAWLLAAALWQVRVGRRTPAALARGLVRDHPVTVALAGLCVLALPLLAATGQAGQQLANQLDGYYDVKDRGLGLVHGGLHRAVGYEVVAFAAGVGLVPAALALVWAVKGAGGRLDDGREARAGSDPPAAGVAGTAKRGRRADEPHRDLALLALLVLGALFAATMYSQGGDLGAMGEERYYLYAVPFVWVGALSALRHADVGWRALAPAGVALTAVLALTPLPVALTGERAFLAPVTSSLAHLGLERLAVGATAAVLTALAALAWRSSHRTAALVPAVALQLALTAYALAALHGDVDGVGGHEVPGTTFAELGWVDRATDGSPHVTYADSTPRDEQALRRLAFYNDEVRASAASDCRALPIPLDTLTCPAPRRGLLVTRAPPRRAPLATGGGFALVNAGG